MGFILSIIHYKCICFSFQAENAKWRGSFLSPAPRKEKDPRPVPPEVLAIGYVLVNLSALKDWLRVAVKDPFSPFSFPMVSNANLKTPQFFLFRFVLPY